MTDPGERIGVLLIDDHSLVRTGLRMLIDSDPGCVVVGEAGTRGDALAVAQAAQPAVVLLDLDLGSDRGLEMLPDLLSCSPNARVLILTGLHDSVVHRDAVRRGARGVLLKDQAAGSLLKAIRKVHDGELWLDRSLTADLINDLTGTSSRGEDPEQAKIATLTRREREVIGLIAEGLKNKDVADRLFISETTVRHHLTAIFSKLDVSDRLGLVLYAFHNGLATLRK